MVLIRRYDKCLCFHHVLINYACFEKYKEHAFCTYEARSYENSLYFFYQINTFSHIFSVLIIIHNTFII